MARSRPATPPETSLYAPVKTLLEGQGYTVKGEINGCDVVAVRGDEPPVVVELKKTFGLGLVLQGIDRLAMTDAVYVAVGTWPTRQRETRRLCRRSCGESRSRGRGGPECRNTVRVKAGRT